MTFHRRPPVAAAVVALSLVAASIFAAACGSDANLDDGTLTALDEPTAKPTAKATAPTAKPAPAPTEEPEALPFALEFPEPTPTPIFDFGDVVFVDATGPAAEGAPAPPAVTVAKTTGSRWKYRALLGKLDPDEQVVAAVTAAPVAAPGTFPLTGEPGDAALGRAVVIKIDNSNAARPQTGINTADIVYEEMVESGITRLAAVFHSKGLGTIGPVRSARSTDIAIIDSLGEPVFAFSGANSIFDGLIDKQPIVNRGAEVFSGYWRGAGVAPHNLFTSTSTMLDGVSPSAPPAHFAYRSADDELPADAVPTSKITLTYSASSYAISYEWDEASGGWRRSQSGWAHTDSSGVQVAPENVIVQFVNYVDTGMSDKFDDIIVEASAIGTGPAFVFVDGHVIEATWTKPTLREPTTYTDVDGNHIKLTPGKTWVAIVPAGGATWK